jgi:NADH-quinone oxidoreductase subunit K
VFELPQITMQPVPMEHGLLLAAILFILGLVGVLTRRNLVFVLMSLEIMLNATGLAFIVASSRWGQVDGQIMFLMIISLAAAEVAVALGLVLQLFHKRKTLDINILGDMKG